MTSNEYEYLYVCTLCYSIENYGIGWKNENTFFVKNLYLAAKIHIHYKLIHTLHIVAVLATDVCQE